MVTNSDQLELNQGSYYQFCLMFIDMYLYLGVKNEALPGKYHWRICRELTNRKSHGPNNQSRLHFQTVAWDSRMEDLSDKGFDSKTPLESK